MKWVIVFVAIHTVEDEENTMMYLEANPDEDACCCYDPVECKVGMG